MRYDIFSYSRCSSFIRLSSYRTKFFIRTLVFNLLTYFFFEFISYYRIKMLPNETKHNTSSGIPSSLINERHSSMCLLPSNLNKQYHSTPSTSMHQYRTPFPSEWNINNKMIPYEYYLQLGQYENMNNDHYRPDPTYPPFTSIESSLSSSTFNGYSMTSAIGKRQLSDINPLYNKRFRSTYSVEETKSDANQSYIPMSSSITKRSKKIYYL